MTTYQQPAPQTATAPRSYQKGSILADWLSSTDHKIIGHLYMITSQQKLENASGGAQ